MALALGLAFGLGSSDRAGAGASASARVEARLGCCWAKAGSGLEPGLKLRLGLAPDLTLARAER